MASKIFYVVMICIAASAWGFEFYTHGDFGGYYIEQEIYNGNPVTWLWHNHHIVWSHHTDLKDLTSSTFSDDRLQAKIKIQEIKTAETLVP